MPGQNPTRAPKRPPFPIGTRLVCVSDRGDVHCEEIIDGKIVPFRIFGRGFEVVIDEIKTGRRGTGRQLENDGGPMFYEDTDDPVIDETQDGMSVYHVTVGNRKLGRLIRHENKGEWRRVRAKRAAKEI